MSVDPDAPIPPVGEDDGATDADPHLQQASSRVARLKDEIRYPIRDYEDLLQALGGEETEIRIGDRDLSLADAREAIPAYYFPIASQPDLIAKLADLSAQGGVPQQILATWTNVGERPEASGAGGWS